MIRQKSTYCLPEPCGDDKAGDGLPDFMMRDIKAPERIRESALPAEEETVEPLPDHSRFDPMLRALAASCARIGAKCGNRSVAAQKRPEQRLAHATIRQPQGGRGECTERAGLGSRRRVGVPARGAAGGGDRRSSTSGVRCATAKARPAGSSARCSAGDGRCSSRRGRAKDKTIDLHGTAGKSAQVSAKLAPGVLGDVQGCDGAWCRIYAGDISGYIGQELVWGAYPGEKIN